MSTTAASQPMAQQPSLEFYIDPHAPAEEKLITYSAALHEYTRQLWLEARRRAEVEAAARKSEVKGLNHPVQPAVKQHV